MDINIKTNERTINLTKTKLPKAWWFAIFFGLLYALSFLVHPIWEFRFYLDNNNGSVSEALKSRYSLGSGLRQHCKESWFMSDLRFYLTFARYVVASLGFVSLILGLFRLGVRPTQSAYQEIGVDISNSKALDASAEEFNPANTHVLNFENGKFSRGIGKP